MTPPRAPITILSAARPSARAAAALLVVGLLGACSDEPEPWLPPSTQVPSTLQTTDPPVTEPPPELPKAAPTPRNAERFVRYFFKVHNYAYLTLDSRQFKEFSGPDCGFCSRTMKDINRKRSSGTRVEGAEVLLDSLAAPPIKVRTGIIVATTISQRPGRVFRKDGTMQTTRGTPLERAYVGLLWAEDHWLVDDVALGENTDQ